MGPVVAAWVLGEMGDMQRFPTEGHLARYAGIAPLTWASGQSWVGRVDPGGHRRLNRAVHQIALTQRRWVPEVRASDERQLQEGKTPRAALRVIKRWVVRQLFQLLRPAPTPYPLLPQPRSLTQKASHRGKRPSLLGAVSRPLT
ncbi:MAG: IS110 family transposase [Deinococcus sp.]|nr:IS110 family transposase [Deinococcus sp.]